jgi:hypothetical protein
MRSFALLIGFIATPGIIAAMPASDGHKMDAPHDHTMDALGDHKVYSRNRDLQKSLAEDKKVLAYAEDAAMKCCENDRSCCTKMGENRVKRAFPGYLAATSRKARRDALRLVAELNTPQATPPRRRRGFFGRFG